MGTVTILGMGLIGGSYGLAIRERGLAERVVGCARTAGTLRKALERGAADEVTSDVSAACAAADMLILCQPPEAIMAMMPGIAEAVGPDTVVTDAASVKAPVVCIGERCLADPGRFVGGHPMAGSERTGVEHARADLFEGAAYVLTPTDRTSEPSLTAVRELAEALGAQVIEMGAEEHDRAVGAASHVPHLVASALALAVLADEHVVEVHGAGLRDATRIAAADPEMWRQIVMANRDAIREPLARVQAELARVHQALDEGDGQAVAGWLRAASELRRGLGSRS